MTTTTIAVIGAGGGVGRHLVSQLAQAGHAVRGLVRKQEQADALEALGGQAVLGDLTDDWKPVLDGADAVIWAAGAGASGDFERIDYQALVELAQTLQAGGPRRLVVVSSLGVDRPEQMPPFLQDVLRVKAKSDAFVQASGLDSTIVRPGGLQDTPGTGQVTVGMPAPGGMIPREDVARVVVACLGEPTTVGQTFEVVAGETPIVEALAGL